MPQITKLRIVNFQYNDGKRLIADELYDFESSNKGPSDVLINLANGGGKSVLVQLMMQPIIPKAKVAGRRIESFFTKSSDHCYVAIEWALDGSKMKLMTGIAMATSDSSGDTDTDRGFQIKYYTFISSYHNYGSNYDIISLPLSKKEDGRFVPACFDDIRNLAKKSNGSLERFASDDGIKWKERLAQYGIFQNEWKMIEDLNSNEDGLSKFFSTLKTSDAVIDRLIIPRIEEKQSHDMSRDDSSLETMLISYAKYYSRQKEIIREREICSGFYDMLKQTKYDAENLWKSNDSLEKSIKSLFAFSDALEAEIVNKNEQAKKLATEQNELNEKIRHIQWEKISAEYYSCKESFERATAEYQKAEAEKSEAKEKQVAAGKKLLLIECAHYYGQLKEIDSQITVISAEITSRVNNTESSSKLASLRYSAWLSINKELEILEPEIKMLSSEKDSLETTITELSGEIDSLRIDVKEVETQTNKNQAVYEMLMRENDAKIEELGINACRMLDGKYQALDLDCWKDETQKKKQIIAVEIEENAVRLQKLDVRRELIPQEIADINTVIRDSSSELDRLKGELDIFRKAERTIQSICEKHNLDYELRFSDYINDYLTDQVSLTEASIADEERKIEATEEAVASVKRGTLHIPKILLTFLDGTGLQYTSVEKYLLTQQNNGLISAKRCQELLAMYPYAAYGVILDEKAIETLYQESDRSWLPSVLPVFTQAELNMLMQGEAPSFSSISAYSKEYFQDSISFEAKLQKNLDRYNIRLDQLKERRNLLLEDIESVKGFACYDCNWEATTLSEIRNLQETVSTKKTLKEKLYREHEEIKKDILRCKSEEKRLIDNFNSIKQLFSEFEKLLKKLNDEDQLLSEYEVSKRRYYELQEQLTDKLSTKKALELSFKNKADKLKNMNEMLSTLQEGVETVSGADESETIDGKWDELLAQYKKLLEVQSADLKKLNDEISRYLKEKEEKQKEIKKRGCNQNEFESLIYSDDLEEEAVAIKKDSEKHYQDLTESFEKYSRAQGIAEASLGGAKERLCEYGGEALPFNEVGKAFDSRISEIKTKLHEILSVESKIKTELAQLQKVMGKTERSTEDFSRPSNVGCINLEKDLADQLNVLLMKIRECENDVTDDKSRVENGLKKMVSAYGSGSSDVNLAISSMQDLLTSSVIRGDKYYTLCEHIDANMHTAELRISQIDTDLKEFHKTKDDLVRQCVIQGKQMFEGLMQLANNSKVKVHDRRRQMLKFDIPETVDENIAVASITSEIEKGTEEIVAAMEKDGYSESEVHRLAAKTVGSKRLLRKYIGAENIVLKAYKIDRNPDNSGYRTWEQTQVNNSGAEKFVVYFAVILALMAYTRDSYDDMGGKTNRSVLVLDNPFGPISSKHVLEPMFGISKNYNVQMICLSDISKSDIVSCFDLVIRAVVKRFAFSSKEQLTHEGNEFIEHGFYRDEQISLFGNQGS